MDAGFWLEDPDGIGPVVLSDSEGLRVAWVVRAGAPILEAAPRLYEAVRRVLAKVVQGGDGVTFLRLSKSELAELRAAVALVEQKSLR